MVDRAIGEPDNANFSALQAKFADLQDDDDELSNANILRKDIAWDTLHRADLINDVDLNRIKIFDKKSSEERDAVLDDEGVTYAELFVNLVSNLNKPTELQYVLALVDEVLSQDETRVNLFLQLREMDSSLPFAPFLRLLNRAGADPFIKSRASKIVATLMSGAKGNVAEEDVKFLSHWCGEQLRLEDVKEVSIALCTLQCFLRRDEHRLIFVNDDGLKLLSGALRIPGAKRQLLYLTIYSLWLLSYNHKISERFCHAPELIKLIVDVIRREEKEKLRRLGLATLRNIVDYEENGEQMVDAGMVKVINYLSQKKWGDEDIEDDIKYLSESLEKSIITLSSFEKYKEEVQSGELTWSPVHRSERFWRENVGRFEEDRFYILRVLLDYIRRGAEPKIICVACYDLGEFVRFHPRGRRTIAELDGKVEIMKLMTHPDEEVQKQALLCVQKMMVHNWEYLARGNK